MIGRPVKAGDRFGRLTIVESIGPRGGRFLCRCDCGKTIEVVAAKLLAHHTLSCGCLRREQARDRLAAIERCREAAANRVPRDRTTRECGWEGCRERAGHGLWGAFCAGHAARLAVIREALERGPRRLKEIEELEPAA